MVHVVGLESFKGFVCPNSTDCGSSPELIFKPLVGQKFSKDHSRPKEVILGKECPYLKLGGKTSVILAVLVNLSIPYNFLDPKDNKLCS